LGASERPGIELLTTGRSRPPAEAAYPCLNCPELCSSPGLSLKKNSKNGFGGPNKKKKQKIFPGLTPESFLFLQPNILLGGRIA
jgi:hypothetical protein